MRLHPIKYLLLGLAITLSGTNAQANPAALESIPKLDLTRYMGTWYEIARLPNRFQKKCRGQARADYQLQTDGRIRVTNRCPLADGTIDEAIGHARLNGEAGSSRLQVRFAPEWLSFLPMVWGNYWVIDLDTDYQLAAISEPNREYLWILSRSPQVDSKHYQQLLLRLQAQGLAIDKLEQTAQ